jgi:ADP-dependent glucokinase
LIVSGTELLKELNLKTGLVNPVNHKSLSNLEHFKECFMYFFRKGSAAERSFNYVEDFETITSHIHKLRKQQWFIGGNAGLMAEGISKRIDNSEIILVGPVGPKLKHLLNKNIRVPQNSVIKNDEIHLILEYDANETFENVQTPNANRFIVSHDVYNSKMIMLQEFFNITQIHRPDIIILSGLHLLESQDDDFR